MILQLRAALTQRDTVRFFLLSQVNDNFLVADFYFVPAEECLDFAAALRVGFLFCFGPPIFVDEVVIRLGGGGGCPVAAIEGRDWNPVRAFPEAPHQYAFDGWTGKADAVEIDDRFRFGLFLLVGELCAALFVIFGMLAGEVEFGDANPERYLLALRQVLDEARLRRQIVEPDAMGPAA